MAKTDLEHRQGLAQLFCEAGEVQFMLRMYRKTIEDANNKLNTINQKIENAQKAYNTFVSTNKAAPAPIEASKAVETVSTVTEPAAATEAANAVSST
jgi:HPt (histidine-containing phosphotransfer) domain-containing protein